MARGTIVIGSLVWLLSIAEPVSAGTVFGIIREGNQPAANAPVALRCGGQSGDSQTDSRGTYRLTVRGTGRCELAVRGLPTQIVLYDEPVRYDFEIVGAGAASRLIRR